MENKRHANPYGLIYLFISLSLLLSTACQHIHAGNQGLKSADYDIKKIVVIGFKPAISQGGEAYDDPAETALLENAYYMTSSLFETMSTYEGYELISPDTARETKSRIAASEPGLGDAEIAGMVARELQADAALTGNLYRWREREGSDYAIKSPSSVFFDLCLVSPDDGSILWKGRFNKTQRSLNKNLLDIRTFIKGKGKWMTAEGLAELGLKDLVDDLFLFIEKGKGTVD